MDITLLLPALLLLIALAAPRYGVDSRDGDSLWTTHPGPPDPPPPPRRRSTPAADLTALLGLVHRGRGARPTPERP